MTSRVLNFTETELSEMEALYKHGWSCDRLAKRFGCLSGSIHQRLLARGVTMRSPHSRRRRAFVHTHGYVKWGDSYVHRIVVEAMLGRPLEPGEVVHHIDGDPTNNHPDNLQVFASQSEHMRAEYDKRTFWTLERDGELMRLRAEGKTAREIALALGTTFHAVTNRVRGLVAVGLVEKIGTKPSGPSLQNNPSGKRLLKRIRASHLTTRDEEAA